MKIKPQVPVPAALTKMRDMGMVIPGYTINEYLLVLSPHEALRNKIMQVKQHFADTYNTTTALHSRPHVTLVNFVQYQLTEERLVNRLKVIAMAHPPVKIELKDYGSFPSHTIYINITSKLPIQNLVKNIRTETQQLMKLNADNKPHFMMEPYITIARKLQPAQYEKGWLHYSHSDFTSRFIADAMLLLKRPVGTLKYEIAQRFEFQNLPVGTKQGDLFG
jgi:2'-5' RNA ligase